MHSFILRPICRSVCSPTSKCNKGMGHCSTDEDCKEDLRCGRKNCIKSESKNCCYRPDGKHNILLLPVGNDINYIFGTLKICINNIIISYSIGI